MPAEQAGRKEGQAWAWGLAIPPAAGSLGRQQEVCGADTTSPAGCLFCIWFHCLPCFFRTDSLWPWDDFSSSSSASMWHQWNRQPQWQKADSVCICVCWGQRCVVGSRHKEEEKELAALSLAILVASPNIVRKVQRQTGAREGWSPKGAKCHLPCFFITLQGF